MNSPGSSSSAPSLVSFDPLGGTQSHLSERPAENESLLPGRVETIDHFSLGPIQRLPSQLHCAPRPPIRPNQESRPHEVKTECPEICPAKSNSPRAEFLDRRNAKRVLDGLKPVHGQSSVGPHAPGKLRISAPWPHVFHHEGRIQRRRVERSH